MNKTLEKLKEYIESGAYKYSPPMIGQEEVECCIAVLEKHVVGNWISVERILPENAERYKGKKAIDVLVTTKGGRVSKVQRKKNTFNKNNQYWYWARINSEVIAWQPLPKPYKKDGELSE